MKRNLFLIYFLIVNTFLLFDAKSNIENKIVLKVGNKIITSYEVKNKILRSLFLSNTEVNQKNINNIKSQILENLILLKLKEVELEKYNFKADKTKVNNYILRSTSNDKFTIKEKFKNNDLDFNLYIKEIETEFKWRQFIFRQYSNKIEINQSLIIEEVNKILNSKSVSKEYNLSEIEILKSTAETNEKLTLKILQEIKSNGFESTALKLSKSSKASQKGNLGWINEKMLSKRIYNIVEKMKPGQISEPIIEVDNILFLKLNSIRDIENNIDADKLKNTLLDQKRNEMFDLYSKSHLSKLKNNFFIEYK